MAALRLGGALVIVGVIVAQMLGAADGLGYLITRHRTLLNSPGVYAGIVLVLLITGIHEMLLRRLEREVAAYRQGDVTAMPEAVLATTVVGSYPAARLARRPRVLAKGVPRVRLQAMWRVPEALLEQAQDDATARRDPRHGAGRHRHRQRRRDPARELLEPLRDGARRHRRRRARARSRTRTAATTPRAAGGRANPAARPGRAARRAVPRAATPTAATKITLPGPFTLAQQAKNEFYQDEEEMAMDYAAAVNEEARDLKARAPT